MNHRIGFMQGRLSPLVDGKIQAFPWDSWQHEFTMAENLHLNLMEWTLDQDRLYQNPLMNEPGQREILELCKTHGVAIQSLTGDCFMQAPFYKKEGAERDSLMTDIQNIIRACHAVGIAFIVFPLVDHGRLENVAQEANLKSGLEACTSLLKELNVKVVFESDFEPTALGQFMQFFPKDIFGINYDIGNSASLGWDPRAEFLAFGERILNVHVKDRLLGGTTVPLGAGSANFELVFSLLAQYKYCGDFILQTARASDADHAAALTHYHLMVKEWLKAAA